MPAPVDVDTMGQPIDSLSREERVRRRAQELYRLRGDRPGSAMDDWLRAEEEIRAEQAVDEALEASFPASDPPAHQGTTWRK
jgi:Protein of unknown function (DUF2934)